MSAKPHLSLLFAGLGGIEGAAQAWGGLRVPMLGRLCARATAGRNRFVSLEQALFALFGYSASQVPVAALTRLADTGQADPGAWLRADPVHLRPQRDGLILVDGALLALSLTEARALVRAVAPSFAHLEGTLEAPVPQRWYLRLREADSIRTQPLPSVVGRDIQALLPTGTQAARWRALLNETQMGLHTTTINIEREDNGLLVANSVWFWGEGMLPPALPPRWQQVWTDEPVSRGLALLTRTPRAALPRDGATWLREVVGGGEHLLVLEGARMAVPYGDVEAWREWMARLDRDWLTPLVQAIGRGALAGLRLIDADGFELTVDRRNIGRWWRRTHRLGRASFYP